MQVVLSTPSGTDCSRNNIRPTALINMTSVLCLGVISRAALFNDLK